MLANHSISIIDAGDLSKVYEPKENSWSNRVVSITPGSMEFLNRKSIDSIDFSMKQLLLVTNITIVFRNRSHEPFQPDATTSLYTNASMGRPFTVHGSIAI